MRYSVRLFYKRSEVQNGEDPEKQIGEEKEQSARQERPAEQKNRRHEREDPSVSPEGFDRGLPVETVGDRRREGE